ncbi:MAG: glycosyltransferase, partial [Kofleriaceae bacterium]
MSNHLLAKHTPLYVDRDLSIIIPAYNEAERITPTLESMSAFLSAHPYRYEIVVVDDGSKDDTVALCRELAERIPHLRVIATSPNRGKGHAVRV